MALSNNYTDVHVLNLDPEDPRRGPFVVTQHSTDPDDPTQQENLYLLRRDGVWIEFAGHVLTPPARRVPVAFDSLGEIVNLLERLAGDVQVLRPAVDQADLRRLLHEIKVGGGMLAHIHAQVVRYKTQKV